MNFFEKYDKNTQYKQKVAEQLKQFENLNKLSKLPDIARYWNQSYTVPKLEQVYGQKNIWKIYAAEFKKSLLESSSNLILSIGSGDCNHEIEIAKELINSNQLDFKFICTELSGERLKRGQKLVSENNLMPYFGFSNEDFNNIELTDKFAGIMAHHTLHHIVELEKLFQQIQIAMLPESRFVVVDMIGRNGHQRWPETLSHVEMIWKWLPDKYKYNHQFKKQHDDFINWDCSNSGFEGIRAQNILPLLIENFKLEYFLGVGGIIDVFVERGYGHNFDIGIPIDKAIIDTIAILNDSLISCGEIKPTIIFATARLKNIELVETSYKHWNAEFCLRKV